MGMNCLDTYALCEIIAGNPKYLQILSQPFLLTNWTLAEFYKVLLKKTNKEEAMGWYEKLRRHSFDVEQETLIHAIDYQAEHKSENLSLFDCVAYLYSLENRHTFVTGDQAFRSRSGVRFIPR